MERRLQRVNDLMKSEYGEEIDLLDTYGPIQMCVFGLTYRHLPTKQRIVFECERGAITVKLIDELDNSFYPSQYFEKSNYTHWEDVDDDLQELVSSTRLLIELLSKKDS